MNEPEPSPQPDPSSSIPHEARARRRRAHRMFYPSDAEGQAAVLADLARRSYPSFELFIFAILGGAILAAGYLLDSEAVLFFGVLAAPLLTSWVGLSIAAITGSLRFFLQTFAALLVSAIIVFLIGLAAGFANTALRAAHPERSPPAQPHLGSRTGSARHRRDPAGDHLRPHRRPNPTCPAWCWPTPSTCPSARRALGSGAGLEDVWPQAVYVALVHFAWATFLGILDLAFMRFRPRSFGGFIFSLLIILAILAALLWFTGLGEAALNLANGENSPGLRLPRRVPRFLSLTVSKSPSPRLNPSPSVTLPKPSVTASRTPTVDVLETPAEPFTPSMTIVPTPIFAQINSPEGGGARVRKTPGGDYLLTLSNGYIVQVLGETEERMGVIWVKIAVERNGERQEGWIIQSLLVTATPVADWEPTETLTPDTIVMIAFTPALLH